MCQLHGAQRVRSIGGARSVRQLEGISCNREGHVLTLPGSRSAAFARGTDQTRARPRWPGATGCRSSEGRSMNVEDLEVVPGFEHENLQGRVWDTASEEELRE